LGWRADRNSPVFGQFQQLLDLSHGAIVVGGNGELLYAGVAGAGPSTAMMMSDGNSSNGPRNKAQGKAGEAQVRQILEEEGFDILGEEVDIEINTPKGPRTLRVDFLVQDSQGKIFAVESKTGGATLSPRQESLNSIMASQGGIIKSHNIPPEFNLYNKRLFSIETIVITLPKP
jgi:hypothetical protein